MFFKILFCSLDRFQLHTAQRGNHRDKPVVMEISRCTTDSVTMTVVPENGSAGESLARSWIMYQKLCQTVILESEIQPGIMSARNYAILTLSHVQNGRHYVLYIISYYINNYMYMCVCVYVCIQNFKVEKKRILKQTTIVSYVIILIYYIL